MMNGNQGHLSPDRGGCPFYMDQKGGVRVTARQIKFCLAYAGCGNATQSAIEAGYSEKTANEQASRLLANVNIQKYLKELQEQNASKKIADARERQEVLTSIIRQEMEEENIVVEGIGDGCSEAIIKKKKSSHKDVLKAIDLLGRMQGAFENRTTLNVLVPVFGGEDSLED